MQVVKFNGYCKFELGDIVKIIIDKETNTLSEKEYIVYDILTSHSLRLMKQKFLLIVSDMDDEERIYEPIEDSFFKLIKENNLNNTDRKGDRVNE